MADYNLSHTGLEIDNAITNWNTALNETVDTTSDKIISGYKAITSDGLMTGTLEVGGIPTILRTHGTGGFIGPQGVFTLTGLPFEPVSIHFFGGYTNLAFDKHQGVWKGLFSDGAFLPLETIDIPYSVITTASSITITSEPLGGYTGQYIVLGFGN